VNELTIGPAIGPAIGVSVSRRALDVVLAVAALVVLSPLLVVIAAAVLVDSRGPVLFRQTRVGAGGAPFTMLKFRSMHVAAAGPEITARDDGRVTRVGRRLRRAGLDELPQLVNVVRGEMTLVGPRPETPALAACYPAELRAVFRYRPGLTGPAQLSLRDEDALPSGSDDVQTRYLADVVPRRVAVDLDFQAHASLRATVTVLRDTLVYVAR
jgi:lipopolysaccharide/colanic/teichoic acid biosynthesis glycosyltransferase